MYTQYHTLARMAMELVLTYMKKNKCNLPIAALPMLWKCAIMTVWKTQRYAAFWALSWTKYSWAARKDGQGQEV